jgi:hypothetical protein
MRGQYIRQPGSGVLSVNGEWVAAVQGAAPNGAVVYLDIPTVTTPDGDDVIDIYVQTTYDGKQFHDRACISLTTADNGNAQKRIVQFGVQPAFDADILTPVEGSLAGNTDVGIPLGIAVRIKVKLTGATAPSYDLSAHLLVV